MTTHSALIAEPVHKAAHQLDDSAQTYAPLIQMLADKDFTLLGDFKRFPLWMWRNTPMLEFVLWLRQHNEGLPPTKQVEFYGLDMYSLYESIAAVLEYLDKVDPEAAAEARRFYSCLGQAGHEGYYGYQIQSGKRRSCEAEVIQQVLALRKNAMRYAKPGDYPSEDDHFQAGQNARLIHSAENYRRTVTAASAWDGPAEHIVVRPSA